MERAGPVPASAVPAVNAAAKGLCPTMASQTARAKLVCVPEQIPRDFCGRQAGACRTLGTPSLRYRARAGNVA